MKFDKILFYTVITLSLFGIMMTFVSYILMIFVFVRRLVFGDPVAGWASLVLSYR